MKIKNLTDAIIGEEYVIKEIETYDEEMKNFLFTLGCYKGEHITVVSILSDLLTIVVKDGRYSIDTDLASVILI